MVLLAEHWLPGAVGVGVTEGDTTAWEVSRDCHYPAEREAGGGQGSEEEDITGWGSSPQWLWGQAESGCPGCASCKHSTTSPIPPFPFRVVVDHPPPPTFQHPAGAGAPCQARDGLSWRVVVMPRLEGGCSSICRAGEGHQLWGEGRAVGRKGKQKALGRSWEGTTGETLQLWRLLPLL